MSVSKQLVIGKRHHDMDRYMTMESFMSNSCPLSSFLHPGVFFLKSMNSYSVATKIGLFSTYLWAGLGWSNF